MQRLLGLAAAGVVSSALLLTGCQNDTNTTARTTSTRTDRAIDVRETGTAGSTVRGRASGSAATGGTMDRSQTTGVRGGTGTGTTSTRTEDAAPPPDNTVSPPEGSPPNPAGGAGSGTGPRSDAGGVGTAGTASVTLTADTPPAAGVPSSASQTLEEQATLASARQPAIPAEAGPTGGTTGTTGTVGTVGTDGLAPIGASAAAAAATDAAQPAAAADHADHHGAKHAMAKVEPAKNAKMKVSGEVHFMAAGDHGVKVTANLKGLTPNGKHGFHIHEKGDLSDPELKGAGAHFNPGGGKHGGPDSKDKERHGGDLGNITADAQGNAKYEVTVHGISVGGDKDGIIGRSVIVHEKADDLKTDPSGESGGRIAGGVIKAVDEKKADAGQAGGAQPASATGADLNK